MASSSTRDKNDFMTTVQLHERSWGMENYAGRPSLEEILDAPVVVFWKQRDGDNSANKPKWKVTLYRDMQEMESYFVSMLFRMQVEVPEQVPARIFKNRQRMVIEGVKVTFKELPNGESTGE
jgi:hypothetical protein